MAFEIIHHVIDNKTNLEYPYFGEGYNFNLRMKVELAIGKVCHHVAMPPDITMLKFDEILTQEEMDIVNDIVGDGSTVYDPIRYSKTGNRIILKDVEFFAADVEQTTGIKLLVTYGPSDPIGNPTIIDQIIIQPVDDNNQERVLTPQELNDLKAAFLNGITIE